ncbi:peptidyl-prolyl cis-trans isomerase [Microbulbifer rhizosphaerae]|uniref:PpiC domain-containing protein n=1 Tax=Microbulbifer rhizosphaerae TaxID=1562603 RepID=A0A7W4ZB20_9GAMM|nr:peptidylprolyl isomerase [Microbulbifer rhizosphaerae]MBB3063161.1 hypothetical protein [Microbulbifer rhizosphaerae]
MNVQKLASMAILSLAIGACSDKSAFDGRGAFVSSDTVSMEQYAEINRIPERALDRRRSAYESFMERSRIASYLLENELDGSLPLKVELQEVANRKIVDAYFEEFAASQLSDSKLKEYYEKNKAEFSKRDYVVSRILLRSSAAESHDSEALIAAAESVREALVAGEAVTSVLDQGKSNTGISVSTEEGVELDSANINTRVAAALSTLQEGDISAVMAASRGLQLFRVDKVVAHEQPYEEVAGKIEYQLKEELRRKEYQRLALLTRSQ